MSRMKITNSHGDRSDDDSSEDTLWQEEVDNFRVSLNSVVEDMMNRLKGKDYNIIYFQEFQRFFGITTKL